MCGRFVIATNLEDIPKVFNARNAVDLKPNYNVAPGQDIPVIINDQVKLLKWGLETKWGSKMINARAETIEEKPTYRDAFQEQRCLILANGFYEWKEKKPLYITIKDRNLFAMAGIYEKDNAAIITTSANHFMKEIHERMPVILEHDKESEYLKKVADARRLIDPSTEELISWSVTPRMNTPKFNNKECIAPL